MHEADLPSVSVLGRIRLPAVIAFEQDNGRAWSHVKGLFDRVAQQDWSLLRPHQLLRLALQFLQLARNETLATLTPITKDLLTRHLSSSHPIRLLLEHLGSYAENFDTRLGYALLAMHESKLMIYRDVHAHASGIGDGRFSVAAIFMELDQDVRAGEILHQYASSVDSDATRDIGGHTLCNIYNVLGRSSHRQRKYENAAQHFRCAERFNKGRIIHGQSRIDITQLGVLPTQAKSSKPRRFCNNLRAGSSARMEC